MGIPPGSALKICLPVQETQVQSLGQKDALEKDVATHSSIIAWEIPLTEEPGDYSSWGHKSHDLVTKQQTSVYKTSSLWYSARAA